MVNAILDVHVLVDVKDVKQFRNLNCWFIKYENVHKVFMKII